MTSTVSCSAILVEKSSSESSITSLSAASDKQINEHRKVTFNTYIFTTPHNSAAYVEYKRKDNETGQQDVADTRRNLSAFVHL